MAEVATTPEPALSEGTADSLSASRRYYALFVLTLVCTANFFNRQVLTLLLEPIRHELSLNDTQVGFLTGIAFTFVNVSLSIPIARLADRWSRRKVIALAVTVWSAMTICCGLAQNFVQLFLARMGVGAGQAGGSPPCHALTGDLFARQQRSTAIAILLMSTPLGMALGFLWGGWALQAFGWRQAFILAGLPGLLIGALVFFTLPEPRKGMADGVRVALRQPPFGSTVRLLWSIRSLRNMTIASMLQTFLQMGLTLWVPSFLMRSYGLSPRAVGTGMALAFGIGLIVGTLVGGRLIDVLGRRDVRWQFWIPTVASVLAATCSVAAFTGPPRDVFLLLGAQIVFGSLFASSMTAIAQSLVPIAVRATTIACVLFVINVVAIGIGPQVMGIVSDLLRASYGEDSLRITLIGSAMSALPAALFYFLASRTYRSDLAAADRRIQ
jgi:predicted MFS family arabinose efflux permease